GGGVMGGLAGRLGMGMGSSRREGQRAGVTTVVHRLYPAAGCTLQEQFLEGRRAGGSDCGTPSIAFARLHIARAVFHRQRTAEILWAKGQAGGCVRGPGRTGAKSSVEASRLSAKSSGNASRHRACRRNSGQERSGGPMISGGRSAS